MSSRKKFSQKMKNERLTRNFLFYNKVFQKGGEIARQSQNSTSGLVDELHHYGNE